MGQRFRTAVKKCLEVARNNRFNFASKVYPFHLWPEELLASLRGSTPVQASDISSMRGRGKRDVSDAGSENTYTYGYVDYREKNMVSSIKVRIA